MIIWMVAAGFMLILTAAYLAGIVPLQAVVETVVLASVIGLVNWGLGFIPFEDFGIHFSRFSMAFSSTLILWSLKRWWWG